MISYDLIAGRRLSAPPQVRYTDRPEEWRISCAGRALRPVTSWRAVIATARKIDATTVIAETTEGIAASGVDILVLLDVFFASFRDAVAGAEKGRELWFALWGTGADGKAAEYIEFQFAGFPAIDPPGEAPKPLPIRPTTTLNGIFGAVRLVDANGNDLTTDGQTITVSGGLQEDSDPLDAYQAYSDTFGPYTWLDKTMSSPTLVFFKYQRGLKKVTFLALADNEESNGDVRLIAAVDGVDVATFSVAITATAELITLPLEVTAGMLTIRRAADDELDTLDGAVRIFAVSTWRAAA